MKINTEPRHVIFRAGDLFFMAEFLRYHEDGAGVYRLQGAADPDQVASILGDALYFERGSGPSHPSNGVYP